MLGDASPIPIGLPARIVTEVAHVFSPRSASGFLSPYYGLLSKPLVFLFSVSESFKSNLLSPGMDTRRSVVCK